MKAKQDQISFWITIVSFVGSIVFVAHMVFTGDVANDQCLQCVEKALYYQHRADSLQHELDKQTK